MQELLAVPDESLPPIARFARNPADRSLSRIEEEVKNSLDRLHWKKSLDSGDEVAITAGSRGISNVAEILTSAVEYLQGRGLRPFVFPAMGSHGGASAQGQLEVLDSLGITEETLGCPIKSSMETVKIAETERGFPVYMDKQAHQAEGVLVANRVKPHTSFTGDIQSGLIKMMVIAMGKQQGARMAHKQAFAHGLREIVPEVGRLILEEAPVVGGLALVEDFYDQTAIIEGLKPEEFFEEEPKLLQKSKKLMPTLPTTQADILIVDEMGKNISGTGMDTKVVGRIRTLGEKEPEYPEISRIYARDLTEESHGNAVGVGLADFVHRRLVDKIKREATYLNCLTGTGPEKGRIPITFSQDKTALKASLASIGTEPSEAKLIWVKNTMDLKEFYLTRSMIESLEVEEAEQLERRGDWERFKFDNQGNFIPGEYFGG